MKIRIDCPALDGGGARLDIVDVTGGDELPPSRGGVRDWAEVTITVAVGSPAHGVLHKVSESGQALNVEGYEGKWLIQGERMSGFPSDGVARLTLCSAG